MLFYVDTNSTANGHGARPQTRAYSTSCLGHAPQRFTGSTSQVEPCLLLAFWISLQLPTPVAPPIVPAQTSTGESDGWRLRSQPHHRREPIKRTTAGFGLPGNVSDRGEDHDDRSAACPDDLPWRRPLPPI